MNSAVIALARLQRSRKEETLFQHFLSDWSRINLRLVEEGLKEE